MQSERDDTLEERYAIKFCFKLGKKNATETYGMFQTAFRPSCINRWGLPEVVGKVQQVHLQPEEITSKETRVSCMYYQ